MTLRRVYFLDDKTSRHDHQFSHCQTARLTAGKCEPTTAVSSCIARNHYHDAIMGAIASQITSFTIVYSIVYSDADQRKHHNVSIWWRHRVIIRDLPCNRIVMSSSKYGGLAIFHWPLVTFTEENSISNRKANVMKSVSIYNGRSTDVRPQGFYLVNAF